METLKKYWPVAVVALVAAVLLFTDKGKRMVETAKLWLK